MGGIQSGLKKGDEMREKKSFFKFKTSLPTHVSEHENDNLKINMRKNFYLGRRPGRGKRLVINLCHVSFVLGKHWK